MNEENKVSAEVDAKIIETPGINNPNPIIDGKIADVVVETPVAEVTPEVVVETPVEGTPDVVNEQPVEVAPEVVTS